MINRFDPIINPIIYTECVFKIIAMGFVAGENAYLRDGWNVLDFVVVVSSAISQILVNIRPGHSESSGV